MRILVFMMIALFAAFPAYSADDAATPVKTVKWHDSEAEFRLEVVPELPNLDSYINLRTLCLPGDMENGVRVLDAEGNPAVYWQYPNGDGVAIRSDLKTEPLFMYFGYKNKIGRQKQIWNDPPVVQPLRMFSTSGDTAFKTAAAKFDSEDANETSITDFFKPQFKRGGKAVPQVQIRTRSWDTDGHFLVCFYGQLHVPETGDYSFRLYSTSTRILKIDGKTVCRRFGVQSDNANPQAGTSEDVTVRLEKGMRTFEFYYYRGAVMMWAAAAWKRPGNGSYSILASEDFSPAMPPAILSCTSVSGVKYPVAVCNDSLALYTGKRENVPLNSYEVILPVGGNYKWEFGGRKYDSRFSLFAVGADSEKDFRLVPEDDSFAPLSISNAQRALEKLPVRPDCSLKLWFPRFLYDDEYAECCVEMRSRLPVKTAMTLKCSVSRKDANFKTGEEVVIFDRMPSVFENRYAGDRIRKKYARVNGSDYLTHIAVDYEFSMPGQVFDRKGFVFAPVSELPEMTCDAEGLKDSTGRLMIPVMHRPTLHDVRAWELPRSIGSQLRTVKKLLVVADDCDGFRNKLEKALGDNGIKVDFVPWKDVPGASGSITLESLPGILRRIASSDADSVLLLPLPLSKRGVISERDELYAVALLIEAARLKSSVKEVRLASPFPAGDAEKEVIDEENAFTENLRRIRREYGLRMIELGDTLKLGRVPETEHASEAVKMIVSEFSAGLQ